MLRKSLVFPLVPLLALTVIACSDDDGTTGTGGAGGSSSDGGGGMGGTGAAGGEGGAGATGGAGGDGGMGGSGGSDTTPPTVSITDDVADPVATGDVTFTFAFSEDVGTSFEASDVTVTGGTAGTFASVDATTATLVVAPNANSTGTIEVSVGAGTFEDLAGNANTDAATATQDYDTVLATVLVDFEGAPAPTMTGFGDLNGSVVTDPTDGNNTVGQLDKTAIAQLWAGSTVSYCANFGITPLPFTATETTMSMRVWSPDANIPIRVKVENSTDPNVSVETEATTTMAGAWETLTFDFANEAPGTAALNLGATYDKISAFPNFGTDGPTAGAKTYYIDDITFLGASFTADCPAIPVDLRPDAGDAWIGYNGGTLTIFDQFAGGGAGGTGRGGSRLRHPLRAPRDPAGRLHRGEPPDRGHRLRW